LAAAAAVPRERQQDQVALVVEERTTRQREQERQVRVMTAAAVRLLIPIMVGAAGAAVRLLEQTELQLLAGQAEQDLQTIIRARQNNILAAVAVEHMRAERLVLAELAAVRQAQTLIQLHRRQAER
jgi:hypothetical protein